MKRRLYIFWSAVLTFVIMPMNVFADGISPILNFFHKDTFIPATIVTVAIILVESALLKWRMKGVSYIGSLWRSVAINTASSAIGSILLLALGRDSYFMDDTMSLVLPLFLITLATEIPLLRFLYRSIQCSWWRAIRVGLLINVVSYLIVFLLEIGLLVSWAAYADHLDKKTLVDWQHPELLKGTSGRIYATESVREGGNSFHRLKYFDMETQSWHSLSNCPSIDPQTWDIEGNLCAVVETNPYDWKLSTLVIASMPDFAILHKLSRDVFNEQGTVEYPRVTDIKISPDKLKVAMLVRVGEAVAYKDDSSCYMLGDKCRLVVLDLHTGNIIATGKRWASRNGLCWLPDSSSVVFSSLKDEALYDTKQADVRDSTSYGMGYARDGQFTSGLYLCNIGSGKIESFMEGSFPVLNLVKNSIIVQSHDDLRIVELNILSRMPRSIAIEHLYDGTCVSPDGSLLLARIPTQGLFRGGSRLVLVDLKDTQKRHIIANDISYAFLWTASE